MTKILLKFIHSEKATKFWPIIGWIYGGDFPKFSGFLRIRTLFVEMLLHNIFSCIELYINRSFRNSFIPFWWIEATNHSSAKKFTRSQFTMLVFQQINPVLILLRPDYFAKKLTVCNSWCNFAINRLNSAADIQLTKNFCLCHFLINKTIQFGWDTINWSQKYYEFVSQTQQIQKIYIL